MKVLKRIVNWHEKYGKKPFNLLNESYLTMLKSHTKLSRNKQLKGAKIKNDIFIQKHPRNLNFRVFKSTILKNKNVTPELEIAFKTAIQNGIKPIYNKKHLTPQAIFNLMLKRSKK